MNRPVTFLHTADWQLGMTRHYLEGGPEGTRFGLVSTALGPRVLDRASARAIVAGGGGGAAVRVAARAVLEGKEQRDGREGGGGGDGGGEWAARVRQGSK